MMQMNLFSPQRHVITFVWGDKYGPSYVERLARSLQRHSNINLIIATPCEDDLPLTRIPGCFARLRAFDPAWQEAYGIAPGDKLLVLDLDLVVTGDVTPLFEGDDTFAILQGVNAVNPNPYNGSVWRLTAGEHADVWDEFSIEKAASIYYYAFPDDQAWFHHMIPKAGAFGPQTGVYAFQKPGWPRGAELPSNARVVAFPGWRDPSAFSYLPWVKEHWA